MDVAQKVQLVSEPEPGADDPRILIRVGGSL